MRVGGRGGEGGKSFKNVTIPNPKPSSGIRTFFKRAKYRREQVTAETESNVPSNAIKSYFIVRLSLTKIIYYYLFCYLYLACIKILVYCDNSIFAQNLAWDIF